MELGIEELRKQTRVEWTEEDALLEQYGKAAVSSVLSYTGRTEEELRSANVARGGSDEVPHAVRVAALMLAAHWYRCREAVAGLSQATVPYGVEWLLRPWTKLTEDGE